MVTFVENASWTRKHDDPSAPFNPSVQRIYYPNSLEDLIEICSSRNPDRFLKAAGSHWSLSEVAVSENWFIETHDPEERYPAMGRTLRDVVPRCLSDDFLNLAAELDAPNEYPIHFESGKRIYQLYSELDYGDTGPGSLARILSAQHGNDHYLGPWAFPTLGAAGGQTVFGALNTGTHGGDWDRPPIADSVMALHLVADGGMHYWIEPETTILAETVVRFTDDDKLRAHYGASKYKGTNPPGGNFHILRRDDIFNAVLVSVGRFGVVYSVVLRAVPQYALHQEVRLAEWQDIKEDIRDTSSPLFKQMAVAGESPRYLEIDISPIPHDNFKRNRCSIQKRSTIPYNPKTDFPALGLAERRGDRSDSEDDMIGAYRFSRAGNSFPLADDFAFNVLCTSSDVLVGALEAALYEFQKLNDHHKVAVGSTLAAVLGDGGSGIFALILLILTLFPTLWPILKGLIEGLGEPTLAGALDVLKKNLLRPRGDPLAGPGLVMWQFIAYFVFSIKQTKPDVTALSYAIMDGWDYRDNICNRNVDSLEVFFDASSTAPRDFVDSLISLEICMETEGKSFIGYIAMRFMGQTRALLGMQQFPMTCSVEVAGLKDAADTEEFMDQAIALAHAHGGILHWGQRNDAHTFDVQAQFGDKLKTWLSALSEITDDGRLRGFNNSFTLRTGLDVLNP